MACYRMKFAFHQQRQIKDNSVISPRAVTYLCSAQILIKHILEIMCCALAQAVNHRHLTSKIHIQFQVGIYCGHSGYWTGFSASTLIFPTSFTSPYSVPSHSYIIDAITSQQLTSLNNIIFK
jgi:hypothetical protein